MKLPSLNIKAIKILGSSCVGQKEIYLRKKALCNKGLQKIDPDFAFHCSLCLKVSLNFAF